LLCPKISEPSAGEGVSISFRQIAEIAGIPADVQSMDARAGGATEAEQAGAELADISGGLTHTNEKTSLYQEDCQRCQRPPAVARRRRRRNSVRTACQNHVRIAREKGKGINGVFGRGSWIRTNDLQYPKLPRYQAALYPDNLGTTSIHAKGSTSKALRPLHQRLNSGWATRSPGAIPYFCAVPAITSSTPFANPPEGMILVDSGSVFSAIRRIRPSARMKIMSSGM
jgi:hypothetical protein